MVIRIATFNTALSRTNGGDLKRALSKKQDSQARQVAQVIAAVSPDIILLNEFDYDADDRTLELFQKNYLSLLIEPYSYSFIAPVNTGIPSGRDLNKDGLVSDEGSDALGYGFFPGQYGMAVLSRFPIDLKLSRTFQQFLWKDLPNAKLPKHADGSDWFDLEDLAILPLSSKSHWDLSIDIEGQTIHCLCSHPTPPVFDGKEKRNACRNHDEIRFWTEYLSQNNHIYDDLGQYGGLDRRASFVILGDLNASINEGDSFSGGIGGLLAHTRVNNDVTPLSEGARQHSPNIDYSEYHTANWRVRADYVLPSIDLLVLNSGVYWPNLLDSMSSIVETASDHRLVFIDIELITS
ncbi:endonuclease/exonuclease/phosphatase family protein [Marinomonas sp. 15G1-11]|uniref:Endonuclease/exonuclease/phosphatase family protein n=1 Tax=Marinomonas phaeophyticola TaxID=3004091 RepID=A0ABT4JWG5_9GAMM|nr:endonuclease/exonuclease/phosphatase family protein [Marinomonas sp. 15G1-11]MCZ2722723.1 endonuclease/exonuclease/phosphatase family protein [Marinomonas sp. 15G1-11]